MPLIIFPKLCQVCTRTNKKFYKQILVTKNEEAYVFLPIWHSKYDMRLKITAEQHFLDSKILKKPVIKSIIKLYFLTF